MKILEVCTSESLGGLELYFVKCCKKLNQDSSLKVQGYIKKDSLIHGSLKDSKIKLRGLDKTGISSRVIQLLSTIRSFQPDIVHSHVKTDLFPIAIAKVISRHKFKHVHTRQMNMPRKKKNPFHSFVYRKIDLVLAITEKLQKQILKNTRVAAEKVQVLYYGVPEPKKSSKVIKDDLNLKIGLVARLDTKKHQHVLLEALDLLNKKGLKASAYLIGRSTDDEYKQKLNEMVSSLSLQDQVHFMGFVNNPIESMSNFDVILLTSSDETFGLVLVEAMRAGVAVVGANGGGVPEIIDHERTGLLFKPGDAKDLAKQLEKLMKDELWRSSLAKAGKTMADQKFNEDIHFETLKSLFRKQLA